MKIDFSRVILSISLIFILMLCLGLVAASNNSNDFIDITYDDNIISVNNEISDSDFSSAYDLDSDKCTDIYLFHFSYEDNNLALSISQYHLCPPIL